MYKIFSRGTFLAVLLMAGCATAIGPSYTPVKEGVVIYRPNGIKSLATLKITVNGAEVCGMADKSYAVLNIMGNVKVGTLDPIDGEFSKTVSAPKGKTTYVRIYQKPIGSASVVGGGLGGYLGAKQRDNSGSTYGPYDIDVIAPEQAVQELRGLKQQEECR